MSSASGIIVLLLTLALFIGLPLVIYYAAKNDKSKDPPVVVVAPDRRNEGTNALLVCPAGLIEYEYGPGSFQRHCQRAVDAGARLEICELPSLALDMDLPEDLAMISETFEAYVQELHASGEFYGFNQFYD